MTELFLNLLNRSIAAGWLTLAIFLLRFLLKKAPRSLTCALWALIPVRLLCPVRLPCPISLLPSAEFLSLYEVRYAPSPSVDSGIPALNDLINPVIGSSFAPAPGASVNPLYVWMFFAGLVWAAGLICLLCHALLGLWRLHRQVREAVPYKDSVWFCDAVSSPFILGLFRPRIYLPSDLKEEVLPHVLAHEQMHLRRLDHWWKAFGYLLLLVFWFHPLLWAAYALFGRDLELACDERVIRSMDLSGKKAYSHALLSCSTGKRTALVCPLAFSEGSVKTRIKHVLSYHKPALWLVMAALILCTAAAVCFLTDPLPETVLDSSDILPPAGQNASREADTGPEPEISGETILPETRSSVSLEDAISDAVLMQNRSSDSNDYDLACCDFTMLEQVTNAPADRDDTHTIICYGWALYQEYQISEKGIQDVGGSHVPAALTFEQDETGYRLTEYWTPRSGSYFNNDVRQRFPAYLADDGIDSQKYILSQMQSCYRQAVEASGLDTAPVIRTLVETIASGPALSSAPQDYLDDHPLEYRELLYYGTYTLRYCFGRFQLGNETGLEGQIMAAVCEELLQTEGTIPADAMTSPTGQYWYDTLLAHAGSLVEPYLPASDSEE